MNLENLLNEKRLLLEAELKPVQGVRFQPTGFPELGPATYTLPNGLEMLLLESSQSVANRLEAVCWNSATQKLAAPLQGMPYVSVTYNGSELTNSILEAHRLNSSYILGDSKNPTAFFNKLHEELVGNNEGAVDIRNLANVVAKYDPNAIIHGLFFARQNLAGGRLRLPRLLSGFIEAQDVRPVESGGVKHDRVEPGSGPSNEGFGNVPYARTEYVADHIYAYFNFDLQCLRSYGLDRPVEDFLLTLGLWKVRRFLETGLRLRTACDLVQKNEVRVEAPDWFALPPTEDFEAALPELLGRIDGLASPPVTVLEFNPPKNWRKEDKAEEST